MIVFRARKVLRKFWFYYFDPTKARAIWCWQNPLFGHKNSFFRKFNRPWWIISLSCRNSVASVTCCKRGTHSSASKQCPYLRGRQWGGLPYSSKFLIFLFSDTLCVNFTLLSLMKDVGAPNFIVIRPIQSKIHIISYIIRTLCIKNVKNFLKSLPPPVWFSISLWFSSWSPFGSKL